MRLEISQLVRFAEMAKEWNVISAILDGYYSNKLESKLEGAEALDAARDAKLVVIALEALQANKNRGEILEMLETARSGE